MTKRELRRAKLEAKHEKASLSIRYGIYNVLRYLLLGFILASLVNLVFTYAFYTPKMYSIGRGNVELAEKYKILNEKIRSLDGTLDELKHRDNTVYRSLFGADTLSLEGIYLDYPAAKYADFADDRLAPIMTSTWKRLDAAARRIYLQSVSLDELQLLAADKEKMTTAMPALIPVDPADIRGDIGPYKPGGRFGPTDGVWRPHKGIDLSGRRGDPIYAAGDGFIYFAGWTSGYGNNIIVEHGYGYRTLYGHLSKISVTKGQFVKRGEQIGDMGSTGRSSGNHLHYEVRYRGATVDPMSYIQVNMDPAEFEKIIEKVNDNAIYEVGEGTNTTE
jgi:murein DD-endopeptidase MepM/ murein hydrolase activator NlpD